MRTWIIRYPDGKLGWARTPTPNFERGNIYAGQRYLIAGLQIVCSNDETMQVYTGLENSDVVMHLTRPWIGECQ